MKLNDGLRESLREHLIWNKSRVDCFVKILMAVLTLKRVNLTQVALAFESEASESSRYRRLQRFFQQVFFDYDAIAYFVMFYMGFLNQSYYLTLDRSNWKWGRKDRNLLTLAVVYKGIAVPIYCLPLNKKGNSNQGERVALMSRFIKRFGTESILGILGDREFIGSDWFRWLDEQNIPYLMRIRKNQRVINGKGKSQSVQNMFKYLAVGEIRQLMFLSQLGSESVYLSGLRLEDGKLLILASNRAFKEPIAMYGLRWEIETLFQALKGRGFNLEESRLLRNARIKKMMALLMIAFVWAHKAGEWKDSRVSPLKCKSHGRLEKSLFRYGLDYLTEVLLKGRCVGEEAQHLLSLLLAPPPPLGEDYRNLALISGQSC